MEEEAETANWRGWNWREREGGLREVWSWRELGFLGRRREGEERGGVKLRTAVEPPLMAVMQSSIASSCLFLLALCAEAGVSSELGSFSCKDRGQNGDYTTLRYGVVLFFFYFSIRIIINFIYKLAH